MTTYSEGIPLDEQDINPDDYVRGIIVAGKKLCKISF
jgi:hypothetical protein